jgi:5'-nucleotidase (lipoprotein e(P4) family)
MRNVIFLSLATYFLFGCQPVATEDNDNLTTSNSQEYLVASTLFTQQSAEYRALCYQAYSLAEMRLEQLKDSLPARAAVVLDLDETVLDNSPYTAWQIKSGNPYTKETWAKWVEMAEAEAVPGVKQFLSFADGLGIELYYVSNRDTSGLNATMQNMEKLGLPQVEKNHFFLKTTTSNKNPRRDSIAEMGANVVLYIGDNLGDFKHLFDDQPNQNRKKAIDQLKNEVGTRFIILPNTLYGEWEGAVYNFDWSLSDQQRDSARKANLVPADVQ